MSKRVCGFYYVGLLIIFGIGFFMCLISVELVIKRLCGDVLVGLLFELL